MSSLLKISNEKIDFSRYYVVQQYDHGWVIKSQSTNETQFISKSELIKLGYLPEEYTEKKNRKTPEAIYIPSKKKILKSDLSHNWRRSDTHMFQLDL